MSQRDPRSTGNCYLNPKCCYDSHDLECPTKFYPPLLSTPTDFCAEALAKRLPIVKCALAKPKKLIIEKEPPPLAKPSTSRHLKNYQKWCYIWRQTYNLLTTKRNTGMRPPVMSSGEVHRYKKEDKELFDRTLHSYHLQGYYIKNATWPDSIRPKPCGSEGEIKEVITKRYERDFPEMRRQRYPNNARNELSLPPRKTQPKSRTSSIKPTSRSPDQFNWESQWAHTKHVEKMKNILSCDINYYGKADPAPDNLVLRPSLSKEGPTQRVGNLLVPQLIFSTIQDSEFDDQATMDAQAYTYDDERKLSKDYYNESRGPILRVRSLSSEIVLTYTQHATGMRFIRSPSVASAAPEYIRDDNQHFSITTKCKDMKFVVLKNEGTTAIRYQWFRYPPNLEAQRMLADSTEYKSIALDEDKSQDTGFDFDKEQSADSPLTVPKRAHLEFHFCQLPGVILPGQSLEFPIIFRSKKPGYFHETLYLLTHPRLSTQDGRCYAVGLSGVCTEVELAEKGNESCEIGGLKRYLNEKILEEESIDVMDSILHRSLLDVTSCSSVCSLPYGRVTAESVFYAHNKYFYYYYGKSEKALELVRQLVQMLVPKTRVEHLAECHLSIQTLYNVVASARQPDDMYWSHLRTNQAEELLADLNKCMVTLSESRMFAWPATDRRKYVTCYSTMVVTFDEILKGFDHIHNMYNQPVMKLMGDRQAEVRVSKWRRDEDIREQMAQRESARIVEVVPQTRGSTPPEKEEGNRVEEVDECSGEYDCYWLSDFEATTPPEHQQEGGGDAPSKDDRSRGSQSEVTTDSASSTPNVEVKVKPPKEQTVMTLLDTMAKQVADERHEVMTEARVKLFEDLICDGIERMLETVDSFNNMLDFRSSDGIVVIDDVC